jgi:hypothetical protein
MLLYVLDEFHLVNDVREREDQGTHLLEENEELGDTLWGVTLLTNY